MLNHVHLARFWAHAPSLAGRIDAASLRVLQRMAAHAQGRPAEEVEANLCLLLDRARFLPSVELFVSLTPHAPAKPIAACASSAEARAVAVHHFLPAWFDRPAEALGEQVQLRFELTPEPAFAAWLPELPLVNDKEPVRVFRR